MQPARPSRDLGRRGRAWRDAGGLLAGRAGAVRLEELDLVDLERCDVRIAAPVRSFDPTEHMPGKAARRMARFAQLAVAAAGEPLDDADLTIGPASRERVAVVMQRAAAASRSTRARVLKNHHEGPESVSPFTVPLVSPNMAACQISILYGITAPVLASFAACAPGSRRWSTPRGCCASGRSTSSSPEARRHCSASP